MPIFFILVTLVIDAIGFGLIMPMMPALIRDVSGADLAHAAIWGGVLATVFGLMQFLFSPLLGNLSDRFGRKVVLLTSLAILAVDYLIMAVAGSIWLLFLGRIIGGITSASHSTANAYVADISAPEDKAANFGMVGAAFGFGFVFGPSLGGLLSTFGPRVPFYVAAALAGANFFFGLFVLPETVTDKIRRPFEWRRANPLGAFKAIGKLPGLQGLMVVFLIYEISFFVYPSIWAYFTLEKFAWDERMVGLSLTVFGLSMAFMQGVAIRPILRKLGEAKTTMLGMGLNVLSFLLLAIAPSGWMIIALTPLSSLGIIASPAIMGIMSRAASDDQQGELQGLTTSLAALGMLMSPIVMTQTFFFFSHEGASPYFPGAPFLFAAVLMAAAMILFAATQPKTSVAAE
ncbi:TCR/Tet family MFS transporter [Halocynthiibacter sp. C4]|uniref:TCR/Tet family MFS transporter n=1 Tax=Halocynthiibacter sp. C4 TaxID=2992758 RepID=UPI00237C412B|nr:TCR/Tet family MFS transporter [Halocynthiibacter sp. C4]MDE0588637.1 TCR/Tet family MFS transporter [Halocynthiibacter sp. C4]